MSIYFLESSQGDKCFFVAQKNKNTGLVGRKLDHTGKENSVYPINSRMYENK